MYSGGRHFARGDREKSKTHLDAVLAQILLQLPDIHLFGVEDGGGQSGIHRRMVAEKFQEIFPAARAAGSDDGPVSYTHLVIAVFAVMALTGQLQPDTVMTIVTMVVAFYFGTQSQKRE